VEEMISLDEQIAHQSHIAAIAHARTDEQKQSVKSAILASLKELKRIKELMREPSDEMLGACMESVLVSGNKACIVIQVASTALLAQVEREMRDE
jgi:hypothetical protein